MSTAIHFGYTQNLMSDKPAPRVFTDALGLLCLPVVTKSLCVYLAPLIAIDVLCIRKGIKPAAKSGIRLRPTTSRAWAELVPAKLIEVSVDPFTRDSTYQV